MQDDLCIRVSLQDPVDPAEQVPSVIVPHPDIIAVAQSMPAQIRQQDIHPVLLTVNSCVEPHADRSIRVAVNTDCIPLDISVLSGDKVRMKLKRVIRTDIDILPEGMFLHPSAAGDIVFLQRILVDTWIMFFGRHRIFIKMCGRTGQGACSRAQSCKNSQIHRALQAIPDTSDHSLVCLIFFPAGLLFSILFSVIHNNAPYCSVLVLRGLPQA